MDFALVAGGAFAASVAVLALLRGVHLALASLADPFVLDMFGNFSNNNLFMWTFTPFLF